jgi:hypothetical protein
MQLLAAKRNPNDAKVPDTVNNEWMLRNYTIHLTVFKSKLFSNAKQFLQLDFSLYTKLYKSVKIIK